MKRIAFLAAITLVVVVFVAALGRGQDATPNSTITLRSGEVVTGVVILTGQITSPAGKHMSAELQCNKGVTMCTVPQAGTYVLVQLPKNRGTYDCANVELYSQGSDPAANGAEKIGEYCLIPK
jgi:hypothetical protein